jgi:hypothetical protein
MDLFPRYSGGCMPQHFILSLLRPTMDSRDAAFAHEHFAVVAMHDKAILHKPRGPTEISGAPTSASIFCRCEQTYCDGFVAGVRFPSITTTAGLTGYTENL